MTAVEKYFFTPLYYPRSPWSVVRWWESRRVVFNVGVGLAGVVTLVAANLFAALPPNPLPVGVPLFPIVVYGIMANVCYSIGAPVDLLLRRLLGDRGAPVGPVLYRYGFVFSLGLTLLPIPLSALVWVLRWFWA